jgi:hypothetical protein
MRALTCAFVLSAALIASGCKDDGKPTGVDSNTPFPESIPPVSTMQADVSDLSSQGLAPQGLCQAASALVAAWVNLNVGVRLAIPVAAFTACVANTPVYVGGNTWRWTASGGAGEAAWTAELTALVREVEGTGEVDWTMQVSGTQLGLDRAVWYDGTTVGAATSGSWTFYDPASTDPPEPVISCDWTREGTPGDDRTLNFENIHQGDENLGDVLRYGLAYPVANITYTDASGENSATIAWDVGDGSGQFTPAQGEPCCWGPRPGYPDQSCE